MILAGVSGALIVSFIAGTCYIILTQFPDKVKRLKLVLMICYALSTLSTFWFIFAVRPNSFAHIAIVYGVMGIFQTAAIPLTMEAVVKVFLLNPKT